MRALYIVGVVAWIFATALARPVHAQTAAPVQLEYLAVAECPDRARVDVDLAALLQGSQASPTRATLSVTRAGEVFVAAISIGDAARELRARSCDDVVHAASLVIAMAIDPNIAAANSTVEVPENLESGEVLGDPTIELPAPAPAEPVVAPPAVASPPVASRDPDEAPSEPLSILPYVGGDVTIVAGVLPRVAFAFGARAGVSFKLLEVGASFTRTFGADGIITNVDGAGGTFRWTAGALDVGLPISLNSGFSLLPRASIGFGIIDWESFGIAHPGSGTSFWAHASVGGELRIAVTSWVSAAVFAEVLVPLLRPAFYLDELPGSEDVHRASAITGIAGIGLRIP